MTIERGDLKGMSPERVFELHKAGELDHLLSPQPELPPVEESEEAVVVRGSADLGARGSKGPELTRDDLKNMSSKEIVAAQKDGLLDHLLGRQP